MNILVFGKTGQVAQELQKFKNVTALSREQADLSVPATCVAAIEEIRPDVIINAAAYTAVDRAEDDAPAAMIINGDAPAAIAMAAAKLDIPFIHISTDYVFDGKALHPWLPDDQVAPLGVYGRSKLRGEEGVCAAKGRYVILRTSWVFSAHGVNFVKTMLRLAQSHTKINIVNDQFGAPTPAYDIAACCMNIAHAFHRGDDNTGIYHYAGQPNTNWAEFAREIFSQADKPIQVIGIATKDYPTNAKRPQNSKLNCESLKQAFGIERPDWRSGLKNVMKDIGEIEQ